MTGMTGMQAERGSETDGFDPETTRRVQGSKRVLAQYRPNTAFFPWGVRTSGLPMSCRCLCIRHWQHPICAFAFCLCHCTTYTNIPHSLGLSDGRRNITYQTSNKVLATRLFIDSRFARRPLTDCTRSISGILLSSFPLPLPRVVAPHIASLPNNTVPRTFYPETSLCILGPENGHTIIASLTRPPPSFEILAVPV